MKKNLKKRGQKIVRRFSRISKKAEQEGKEHIKENLFDRFSHIKDIKILIFEWSLLIGAIILLGTTQAIWFNNSYSIDAFESGGTYTEGTIGKVNSLNPLFSVTDSEKTLSRLLFATLTTIDETGNIAPGLAKSITPSENGKVWTIKLRDNLKWSDGEPLTNSDVIFTTNLIKNAAVISIYDSNLSSVKVSEEEDGSIKFTLPIAYADFITTLNFPILPEHILKDAAPETLIENNFSVAPVTSGPFAFNALQNISQDGEKVIYLSANQNYYKGKPQLNSFAVHAYLTKESLIKALNDNTITATASLSPADADLITSNNIIEKQTAINSGVFAFLNMQSETMKNGELRKAIKQALNLTKIHAIAKDHVSLDYPLIESQIKLNNYPDVISYNTEQASQKFEAAAGENGITINLVTVKKGYLEAVAEEIAKELRDYGLTVNISVREETQEFISSVISRREYDILVYEIELGAEPDLFAYYHSSQASTSGLNLSNYKKSVINDVILGARETIDKSLRTSKYESFLNYWVNDVPAIGLYQSNFAYYHNKNIRAFSDNNKLVTPLDRFTDVVFWQSKKVSKNRTP